MSTWHLPYPGSQPNLQPPVPVILCGSFCPPELSVPLNRASRKVWELTFPGGCLRPMADGSCWENTPSLHPLNGSTVKCTFPTEFPSGIPLPGVSSPQWQLASNHSLYCLLSLSCIPCPYLCFLPSPPRYTTCSGIPASGPASGGTQTKTGSRALLAFSTHHPAS